jgi:hypothetical protein
MSSVIEDKGAPASPHPGEYVPTAPPTTPGSVVASCRHITPDDVVENCGGRPFIGSPPHRRTILSDDVVPEAMPIPKERFFKASNKKDCDVSEEKQCMY